MRFPLIIGVVCIHCRDMGSNFFFQGVEYIPSLVTKYIVHLGSEVLSAISVPLFFIIAGYFFFYHTQEFTRDTYTTKLRKRIKTLLIPYIIWNTVFLLLKIGSVTSTTLMSFSHLSDGALNITPTSILSAFWDTSISPIILSISHPMVVHFPINQPLWFIRDLMVVILLTPLIYIGIKKLRIAFLGIVIIVGLILFPKGWEMIPLSLCFFSIGAFFSITGRNLVVVCRKIKYMPIIYPCLLFVEAILYVRGINLNSGLDVLLKNIILFVGIVACINIFSWLVEHSQVKVNVLLTNSVFFIFASHGFLIVPLQKIMFMCCRQGGSTFGMVLTYVSSIVVTLLLCLGVYWFLHRFCPKVCAVLMGGRV